MAHTVPHGVIASWSTTVRFMPVLPFVRGGLMAMVCVCTHKGSEWSQMLLAHSGRQTKWFRQGRGHVSHDIPPILPPQNKDKDESGNFLPGDLPAQKNRKRCWTCKSKLELAQRALGECKCGKRRNSTNLTPYFSRSSCRHCL